MAELVPPSSVSPRQVIAGGLEQLVSGPNLLTAAEGEGPWRLAWRRFRHNRLALISVIFLAVVVVIAVVLPFIWPYDISTTDFYATYSMPTWKHVLGTDGLGRDAAARLFFALRVSLGVAVLVETANVLLGSVIGLFAGYFRGKVDFALSRILEFTLAFPSLLLAILVTGIFGVWAFAHFGPLGRFLLVSLSLAAVGWTLLARYVRAQALSLRELPFVEAARCAGSSDWKIIRRHIVPNVMSLVIVAVALDISNVVIGEAVLSLLGLGVQEPWSSLGIMITEATGEIDAHPFGVLPPALMLGLLVLAFSFVGNGLRDALDPRHL
jgi:peptide/nickel transport system permease protein